MVKSYERKAKKMKTIEELENEIDNLVDKSYDVELDLSSLSNDLRSIRNKIKDLRVNVEIVSDMGGDLDDLVDLFSQFVDAHVSKYPLQTWKNRIEAELHRLKINEIKKNEEKT